MGQDTFDDQKPFKSADPEGFRFKHLGHASDGNAIEEEVFTVDGSFKAHVFIERLTVRGIKSELTCLKS